MNRITKSLFLSAALSILALPVVAQQQDQPVTGQSIQERKENQQDRIAQGVKSGELTPRETSNLERKEAGLNREERNMREDNGGKLTAADKAKLTRQQNKLSRNIYRDKHNAAKQ
jgi:hypothetical protein